MRTCIFFCAVLLSCSKEVRHFEHEAIAQHIRFLASDSLGGRATGSDGEREAARYISEQFVAIGLEPKGDKGSFLQAFDFASGIHGQGQQGTSSNVVGYLDNDAESTIVIGAHYDHLGTDGQGSSLDANPAEKIHNGADDNASGVAGVLELARYFATNDVKEKNNFVFVCFSGEELGLLGSKYFTDHLPVDTSAINFMINMDMIGRLDEKTRALTIHGTGTSAEWEPLIKKLGSDFSITTDSSGTGPSDHTSFYLKNIPVLHFFTGSHEDYHKPTDDHEKINVAGEAAVLKLIAQLVGEAGDKGKLGFLATKNKMQGNTPSFKVTLGIMPNYAGGTEGLKVDGVTDGKPAAAAGMKQGDIIVSMGEYPIKDIYGYMEALGKFQKGQTIPVKVIRSKKEIELKVTF